MAVIQITSREFREKQASMFALADKGEQVVIRRRGKVSYMLTPVYENDFIPLRSLKTGLKRGAGNTGQGMLPFVPPRKNLINSWSRYELV